MLKSTTNSQTEAACFWTSTQRKGCTILKRRILLHQCTKTRCHSTGETPSLRPAGTIYSTRSCSVTPPWLTMGTGWMPTLRDIHKNKSLESISESNYHSNYHSGILRLELSDRFRIITPRPPSYQFGAGSHHDFRPEALPLQIQEKEDGITKQDTLYNSIPTVQSRHTKYPPI